MLDPASLPAYALDSRVQRLMTTLGERLTHLDREVLREVLRRAGEREGVVEALLDRGLQWDAQLERNRRLEAVAEAALALRRGERDAGRRLDVALGRLYRAPNPGRSRLAPEAVRLVREARQGVSDRLARGPPVVGTRAAGRVSRDRAGCSEGAFTTARKASAARPPSPTRAQMKRRT